MAQAILQDRRAVRAAGIVERHECELRDDGRWVVQDSVTGSGRRHIVAGGRCDCPDHVYRGHVCKHLQAVMVEEQALAQYCADWDARADQVRNRYNKVIPSSPRCPDCGGRLECQSYYVGGRGMLAFMVCTRDESHRALPA